MVCRLPVQLGDQICPPVGALSPSTAARPFGPARGCTGDGGLDDLQAVAAECVTQSAGGPHDVVDRVCGGETENAAPQINDDERDHRVKAS